MPIKLDIGESIAVIRERNNAHLQTSETGRAFLELEATIAAFVKASPRLPLIRSGLFLTVPM